MTRYGILAAGVIMVLGVTVWAQEAATTAPAATAEGAAPQTDAAKLAAQQILLVETLESARAKYEQTLNQLIDLYQVNGDMYRMKLAQKELEALKNAPKGNYMVAAEAMTQAQPTKSIPEADQLLQEGNRLKDLREGDVKANKKQALAKYMELITRYPESDKIDEASYQAAWILDWDINDWRPAMLYYVKCYEWNPVTKTDARIRAAWVAYIHLRDYKKAKELFAVARDHGFTQGERDQATNMVATLTAMGY